MGLGKLTRGLAARIGLGAAILGASLSCSSPTGPSKPSEPGASPKITITASPSTSDIPFNSTLNATISGDSLARVIVSANSFTDTINTPTPGEYSLSVPVTQLGNLSLRAILESNLSSHAKDTANVSVTGTNTPPSFTQKTATPDSVETTDSVAVTFAGSDTRPGLTLITRDGSVADTTLAPSASTVQQTRYVHSATAGKKYITAQLRDTNNAVTKDSVLTKFYNIFPSAMLSIPVHADTAPLSINPKIILNRATGAYDSVRVNMSDGFSQLFTGLKNADTVTFNRVLTTVGVKTLTAKWYHHLGSGTLKDSVEVLLVPNAPPSATLTATADTVNEGQQASYTLSFTDDRGVSEARIYRIANGSDTLLQTIQLNNALSGSRTIQQVLTPGKSDTLEAVVEDRDGLSDTTRAAPVYTDKKPIVTAAALSPGSVIYNPSTNLGLVITAQDEDPITCSATTTQGKNASGGLNLSLGVNNPSVAADSARVSASVECTDSRGQVSSPFTSNLVTVLHSNHITVTVYDATTRALANRNISVNGVSSPINNGVIDTFIRSASLSLKDNDTKWIVGATSDSVAQYDSLGVVSLPSVDGSAVQLYVIPNTTEALSFMKDVALLTSNDTSVIRVTGYNPSLDMDAATPGIQLPTDFLNLVNFKSAPDSASVQRLRYANKSLEDSLSSIIPAPRQVHFVQVDSSVPATVNYAYQDQGHGFGSTQIAGPNVITSYQFWRGVYNKAPSGFFQCQDMLFVLTPRWRGVGLYEESVLIYGLASPADYLDQFMSFGDCSLTEKGKSVMLVQALFSNKIIN